MNATQLVLRMRMSEGGRAASNDDLIKDADRFLNLFGAHANVVKHLIERRGNLDRLGIPDDADDLSEKLRERAAELENSMLDIKTLYALEDLP